MSEKAWLPAFRALLHDTLIEAGVEDEQIAAVLSKVMGGLDGLLAEPGDLSRAVGYLTGFHDWYEQTLCLDAEAGEVGWAVPHVSVERARADLGDDCDNWQIFALVPVAAVAGEAGEGTR